MNAESKVKLYEQFPDYWSLLDGFSVGEGWADLIHTLCVRIKSAGPPEAFKVVQVKEKFGRLCFYVRGASPEVNGLINAAEADSLKVCEDCGTRDGVVTGGKRWIRTLCDPCRDQRANGSLT